MSIFSKYLIPIVLFLLIILAFALRVWFVSDHNIIFWYDQSRDIIQVNQLLSGDLKLFGPSASGTNDTVYHGVLYYYVIAPSVALFQGDPVGVSYFLALLGALSIPLYYYFAYTLTSDRWKSLLFATFLTFSSQSVLLSTLQANPTIAYFLFPVFYISIWKLCYGRKHTLLWSIILGLSYGLIVQAALWLAPLILVPIIFRMYLSKQSKILDVTKLTSKHVLIIFAAITLAVSTMIVTQVKLWHDGVFTFSRLLEGNSAHQRVDISMVLRYLEVYGEQINQIYFPSNAVLAMVIFILAIRQLIGLSSVKRFFYFLILFSPMLITMVFPRYNLHFFFMISLVLYLLLAEFALNLSGKRKQLMMVVTILLFAYPQISNLQYLRTNHYGIFDTWGTTLKDSLNLVDETYKVADGQQFSIDTYTDPYRYNTLWAYVYDWYGKKKYGYSPTFTGSPQTGMVHQGLLSENEQPERVHFGIIQPNTVLPQQLLDDFLSIQLRKGLKLRSSNSYGTLILNNYESTRSATSATLD